MDSVGWDMHMFGRMSPNVHPSLWSNNDIHRHEVGESFAAATSEYYTSSINGGKMDDLAKDFLALSPIFQGVKTCNTNRSNWDNINVVSNTNLIHKEDAKRLEPADMVLAESRESLASQLFTTNTSSRMIHKPNVMNPLTALMKDYGSSAAHDLLQVGSGGGSKERSAGFSTVESVESLDCLLSTTNSNTSASVEDDVISLIFSSDCNNNIWNHVSSGESENSYGSKEYNNCDQAVSQASTIPCTATTNINNVVRSSETRPNSSKRSSKEQKQPQREVCMNNNSHSFELVQSGSATTQGGFRLITDNQLKTKKPRSQKTSNINFQNQPDDASLRSFDEPDMEAIAYMKEMIYRAAAFRPVNLGLELVDKPKRKNVKISSDPQTVAARQRRERISDRIRVLQKLVPGGSKMDTASMLDEAANYLKFLRSQVKSLETLGGGGGGNNNSSSLQDNQNFPMQNFFPFAKP